MPKRLFTKKFVLLGVLVASVLVVTTYVFSSSRFNMLPQIVASTFGHNDHPSFPEIDTQNLSSVQIKILHITKDEYSQQPNGTKYAEGNNEPWCADFVSWVYKEAGVPLKNPNSGSWRIPGTYTLRDYYESIGRFTPASSNYTPKVGDIMLYDNPSSFGQHTNIVIKNDNGIITTIGGNEPGGIRIFKHTKRDSAGFVGYGEL